MDMPAPRSRRPAVEVERLASLDRLIELVGREGLTRDRLLAELQSEAHVLRSQAADAQVNGDEATARQLDLIASEIAHLATVV